MAGVFDILTYVVKLKGGQQVAGGFMQLKDSAEKGLGSANDETERLERNWQAIGATVAAGGVLVATGLVKAADASARLAVSQDTTNKVFESAAGVIDDYATTSVDRLGLSERAFREASSQLGAFLKNLGFDLPEAANEATKLLEVAADLGASFGRSTGEAANAITAVLRKEFDTIERFGVAIKQVDIDARVAALGLSTNTAEALKNAEAVAALSLVYEQAAQFTGKFQSEDNKLFRSQQQLNAAFEDARAAIGEAMLPVMTSLLGVATDALEIFNDLPGPVKELASGFLLTGSAAAILGGGMAALGPTIRAVSRAMTALSITNKQLLIVFGAVATAIGVYNTITGLFTKETKTASEAAIQFADSLSGIGREDTINQMVSALLDRIPGLREELFAAGISIGEFADTFSEFAAAPGPDPDGDFGNFLNLLATKGVDTTKGMRQEMQDLFRTMSEGFDLSAVRELDAIAEAAPGVDEAANAVQNLNSVAGPVEGTMNAIVTAFGNVVDAQPDFSGAISIIGEDLDPLQETLDATAAALDRIFGRFQNADERAAEFEGAIDDTIAALKDQQLAAEDLFDADEEAGRENIANRGRILSAIRTEIEAMLEEGATVDEIEAKVREMTDRWGEASEEADLNAEKAGIVRDILAELSGRTVAELDIVVDEAGLQKARELHQLLSGFELRSLIPGVQTSGATTAQAGAGVASAASSLVFTPAAATGTTGAVATASNINVTLQVDSRDLATAAADGSRRLGGLPFKVSGIN